MELYNIFISYIVMYFYVRCTGFLFCLHFSDVCVLEKIYLKWNNKYIFTYVIYVCIYFFKLCVPIICRYMLCIANYNFVKMWHNTLIKFGIIYLCTCI